MKKSLALICGVASTLALQADPNNYGCCGYNGKSSIEVGAEWLYWKAFQDNLEYATLVQFGAGGAVTSTPLSPNFSKYNSGFRVFAGYNFCNEPWRIRASYARIINSGTTVTTTDNTEAILFNSGIFPIFTNFDFAFSEVDSSWRNRLHYFDLDLAHLFSLCPFIDIEPHLGFRALWIRQSLIIGGLQDIDASILATLRQSYDGYGVEGGLNAMVNICGGFSLIGSLGGSLLYARINLDGHLDNTIDFFPPITTIDADFRLSHLSPTFDAFLGAQYATCAFGMPVELHVGWESHLIMSCCRLQGLSYSDLTLQGLTLGGSVRF